MRKKILTCIGVIAVLAVVLSVTAFAESETTTLPDYNFVYILRHSLEMSLDAFFRTIDAIYIFFANLFG